MGEKKPQPKNRGHLDENYPHHDIMEEIEKKDREFFQRNPHAFWFNPNRWSDPAWPNCAGPREEVEHHTNFDYSTRCGIYIGQNCVRNMLTGGNYSVVIGKDHLAEQTHIPDDLVSIKGVRHFVIRKRRDEWRKALRNYQTNSSQDYWELARLLAQFGVNEAEVWNAISEAVISINLPFGGYKAALYYTTGNNNTCIGYNAGIISKEKESGNETTD